MPALPPSLRIYIQCTCLYGLLHAIPQCWSYRTRMYSRSYSEEAKEVLLVDKAILMAAHAVSAPVIWPLLLRDDLIRLECLARGKPAGEYLPANDDA
jgi:hypothetical protein